MLICDPKQLMILKLTNAEDFQYSRSYWHDDVWYEFEGYLKDEEQFVSYGGEPYADDSYFTVHSTFFPNEPFDHHRYDEDECVTHPWVLILTGDHTYLAVIKRFASYSELCEWYDTPTFDNFTYIY